MVYFRIFSISSLVTFVIVAALLGVFYRQFVLGNLTEMAESKNVALIQAFANSLWPQLAPFVASASEFTPDELRAHPEIAQLRQAVLAQMKGLSVVKVKVYNLDRLTVFSTEAKQIGDDKSNNAGFLAARSGQVASELTHRDTFSAFESVIEDRDVFSSYIPIRRGGSTGPIEGVFEVYDDVTPLIQRLNESQRNIVIGVTLILIILYVLLFFIIRHADQIIRRQYSELKQSGEALRKSEERFRQVISSVSDHIYTTEFTLDGQRINSFISANVEDLTGYPAETFMANRNFWPSTVIHPDDRAAAGAQAARFAQGHNSEMEYRLIRADGRTVWVRDSGRVGKDPFSHNFIIYGVVSDITERKQAEQTLALAHQQALEASQLKIQLPANVSHDLRTPLNAILGYAEMLQEGIYGPLSTQQYSATAEIIDSTGHLLTFVNNLLVQAQIESGQVVLKAIPFAPADLLESVLAVTSPLARTKKLELTVDIAPDVPSTLYGDPYWLCQILANLVNNALKFTQQGKVNVHISGPDEAHWAIQVSDTGLGIPSEAQGYIFDTFRQIDGSTTRTHSGGGLGLSIVKQLTTLMGGQINLTSQVGYGSTFTVCLPLLSVPQKLA